MYQVNYFILNYSYIPKTSIPILGCHTLNAHNQILSASKFLWTFVLISAFYKLFSRMLLNVQ